MDNLIKLSSALKRKKLIAKAVTEIKQFLEDIPDIDSFKTSDELASLVCNVVEYLLASKSKKYKIQKREVVLEIFDSIFVESPLTPQQRVELLKRIEFLHESNLIKPVSIARKIRKQFIPYLLKKII